ncbi:hypothetical protein WMF27_45720 [Sorangium sp. So ce281]|uniref:hypothetical protein n=1 Tax=unclassified Sorangium TaxID=2621164 RepID=UPI003F5E9632
MTRMKLLGLLMAGLSLVACGDDEAGNGGETGGNTSGGGDLDGKQLDELTAAESQQVCADLAGSIELSKEDSCEVIGLGNTILGGDCETFKEQCISAPEDPESIGSCDPSEFAGCTATVAEMKACMTAMTSAMRALTCESSIADLAQQPAACAVVNEKCPELGEGEGEGEGS